MCNQPCLVLVINLQRSVQRRKDIETQLNQAKIAYTLIEAIDGNQALSAPILHAQQKALGADCYTKKNRGEVACTLSHIKCFEALLASEAPYALILEDDALLMPDLNDALQQMDKLPQGWKRVHVFDTGSNAVRFTNRFTIQRWFGKYTVGLSCGTIAHCTAYFINRVYAQQLYYKVFGLGSEIGSEIGSKTGKGLTVQDLATENCWGKLKKNSQIEILGKRTGVALMRRYERELSLYSFHETNKPLVFVTEEGAKNPTIAGHNVACGKPVWRNEYYNFIYKSIEVLGMFFRRPKHARHILQDRGMKFIATFVPPSKHLRSK